MRNFYWCYICLLHILCVIDFLGQQLGLTYLGEMALSIFGKWFALPPKNSGAKISGFYWKTLAPCFGERNFFFLLPQQNVLFVQNEGGGVEENFFLYRFAWRFRITPLGMTSGFVLFYIHLNRALVGGEGAKGAMAPLWEFGKWKGPLQNIFQTLH